LRPALGYFLQDMWIGLMCNKKKNNDASEELQSSFYKRTGLPSSDEEEPPSEWDMGFMCARSSASSTYRSYLV
jgi:hypothetical protein